MSDDPLMSQLKSLSRQRLRVIWEMAQAGGPLDGEDAQIAAIMREHTQWHHLWARLDELSDAEIERGGVNPIMHCIIHQVVTNQIDGATPGVSDALQSLKASGLDRHEAIHRIGAAFTECLWEVMKYKRPFDDAKYLQKLKAMTKPPPLHRPSRRSRRR